MDYYPQPREKKSPLLKLIGIGCGVLLLMGIIGGFITGRLFSTRAPSRTLNSHLRAISSGDLATAYSDFNGRSRERMTLRDFHDTVASFSTSIPFQKTSFSTVNVTSRKATIKGTITGRDGGIIGIKYDLVKENSGWKIERFEWQPPGKLESI